jgi:hypothetical protein
MNNNDNYQTSLDAKNNFYFDDLAKTIPTGIIFK